MTADDTLDRLARMVGIEPRYIDAGGVARYVSSDTKEALIHALGFDAASEVQRSRAIDQLRETRWRQALPPVVVRRAKRGAPVTVPVTLGAHPSAALGWRLTEEDGRTHEACVTANELQVVGRRDCKGTSRYTCLLRLPHRPTFGYHRLEVFGGEWAETTLVVAPTRCFVPTAVARGQRSWGFAVQLYALHSDRSWGIGDFTDLAAFARDAANLGAGFIGLNPLHALFPSRPTHCSPYSPSSRLFLNVMYLDVAAIPDFVESVAERPEDTDRVVENNTRQQKYVDYSAVASRKLAVLARLYRSFRERHIGGERGQTLTERGAAFRRFQERGGVALERHSVFEALCEQFGEQPDWHSWPDGYRNPDSPQVQSFARENWENVEFFQYLQWHCDVQLKAAGEAARAGNMTVGLYHDLALGADRTGAEAWANRHLLAEGAVLGAPPDIWNPKGQSWGLPPYRPTAMYHDRYRMLRALFAANMRHGGALRLDHVMGLKRLFWIPEGGRPADGAYVRYAFDDQLGILALESRRRRSLVIGEDLGTVPAGFRERMRRERIFSYRLLYFERDAAGEMQSPARYPAQSLVSIGTHDLPTLPGYWHGRDLELWKRFGLFSAPQAAREAEETRREDVRLILRGLRRFGFLPQDGEDDESLCFDIVLAVHRYLAAAESRMMVVHLEDILGVEDQVNIPGTVNQYPNWQRRIEPTIEEILRDPRMKALAEAVNTFRAGNGL